MEITLHKRVYAINPRRIIAIESYKTQRLYNDFHKDPFSEDEADECYDRYVIIHMTDDFNIGFRVEDNSEYERLRDELASITESHKGAVL
jgi:hypothetical protein